MCPKLKQVCFAWLILCLSPFAGALSLGEGHLLSYVGEPFVANIELIGNFDKDARFYQVNNTECRSSIIGKTENSCDSLYEGELTFFIKQRPDGRYFLKVTGDRSNELFYRVIVKTKSASTGVVYNAFEFLPEIRSSLKVDLTPSNELDVTLLNGQPSGKYGVVRDKVVELASEEEVKLNPTESRSDPTKEAVELRSSPLISALPKTPKPEVKKPPKKKNISTPASPATVKKLDNEKSSDARLQIEKYGDYADDIYALQKENEAIEQQIVLIEKQIALLKEVAKLKGQIEASGVPATDEAPMSVASAVIASAPIVASAPVAVPAVIVQQVPVSEESSIGWLSWILLALVAFLSALVVLLYRKQRDMQLGRQDELSQPVILSPNKDERESLDLTSSFAPRKW